MVIAVKREDGHVDFFSNFAQKRGGFDGFEPLGAQRFTQRVYLSHHIAQRIARGRPSAANRKIAFAHRCQEIGERLQGERDVIAHRGGKSYPDAYDQNGQRPTGSRLVGAGPQQNQRRGGPRQTRRHRQQNDSALEMQFAHRPYFCILR